MLKGAAGAFGDLKDSQKTCPVKTCLQRFREWPRPAQASPKGTRKMLESGEDSISLEANNAAAANKAGRYFQAQTHFPESMKKSSVTGPAQGEEAPRVSWGRTGYSRQ